MFAFAGPEWCLWLRASGAATDLFYNLLALVGFPFSRVDIGNTSGMLFPGHVSTASYSRLSEMARRSTGSESYLASKGPKSPSSSHSS